MSDTTEPTQNHQPGKASAEPSCSLIDCPAGDNIQAILPYFRKERLRVKVEEWKTLDGSHQEKTVSLKVGSISNRYLSDTELAGAEFFPANVETMDRAPNANQIT